MQTTPGTNVYIHVNNDEADRILIDPAYKMEKMKVQTEEEMTAQGDGEDDVAGPATFSPPMPITPPGMFGGLCCTCAPVRRCQDI